ncbi:hypothetical protein D7V94_22070 [Parablautia intestinalis]|uniref:Phosphoribosyltransferase domain-containing protein n=1 Tax=Parablautia intestinalis TaxID=2320100 RepID=A0A3A9AHT3_9FIRM|nr:phosphoribosyltransferase family protein [Parablautia intestinalis]RKI86941.1 hypothetical protein D7V94_22070 [Parablautia intestinalis]
MFRCISELKGLIIDFDSFRYMETGIWSELMDRYKCLFLAMNGQTAETAEKAYGWRSVYWIEDFQQMFAPNQATHERALDIMGLQPTEVAYISMDCSFLERAMGFLGGTIWVTRRVTYLDASRAPDFICPDVNSLKGLLLNQVSGFLGETAIFPEAGKRGLTAPVQFYVDGNSIPMYMLGRYFGRGHYMNQLHPYSTAILLNKKEGKGYYRKFDGTFAEIYGRVVKALQGKYKIDGIVAVPARSNQDDRFEGILEMIAEKCCIGNFGSSFTCIRDYPTQKRLSASERQKNIGGAFRCGPGLEGKNIVMIDDVITTGATIQECIRELRAGGVNQVIVLVLGVNQFRGTYWSSRTVHVACPVCGEGMSLNVNGNNGNFFYSCHFCNNTISFREGRKILCDKVNSEIFNG